MRLINTATLLLEEVMGDYPGRYAILSHTWENDEISFQDMTLLATTNNNNQSPADSDKIKTKAGYLKVAAFTRAAAADGFTHVWVDTCCIDKTSSAELSEAINSMFRWYSKAARCYVYLADVPDGWESTLARAAEHPDQGGALVTTHIPAHLRRLPWPVRGAVDHSFYQSRWFTRGWTLQELLAPVDVVFYSASWTRGPTKVQIIEHLRRITGIPYAALETGEFSAVSVADRMRWASARETTRVEDMAYCLLGIFDVNMPMLYGEGEKAFLRLQEEICKSSDDHSLFAWRQKPEGDEWALRRSNSSSDDGGDGGAFSVYRGLFAKLPEEFSVPSVSLAPVDADGFVPPMGSTSLGFNAMFPLIPVSEISIADGVVPPVDSVDAENEYLAVLHAKTLLSWHRPGVGSMPGHRVAILVKALSPNASTRQFARVRPSIVYTLTGRTKAALPGPRSLYIRHAIRIPTNHVSRRWTGFVVDVSYRAVTARFGMWSPYGALNLESRGDLIKTPANLAKTNGVAAVVFSTDPLMPFVALLGRSPGDGSPVFWLLKEKVNNPAEFDFSRIGAGSRIEGVKVGDDPPQRVLRFLYSPQSGSTVVLYFTLSWPLLNKFATSFDCQ
ncbi:heterokaryon incompatibility protein-domain-containing protein [Cercophora scortea]|uniref:Heterokaryon incompatibility protein-domain-containing protein n=1 Tax=Cercophora scortea TaxID=314031 RepID=A0AAE0I372_9PEZI|nr:heterokaryon incompatibility protein-domain-containing protein [Cercophora scortea]